MTEDKTAPASIDSRIPWLIVVPFIAIAAIWFWGFQQYKFEEALKGSFPITAEIKTVRLVTDVGNVDVAIGTAGEVGFEANAVRAAGSQAELDKAKAVPFKLSQGQSDDPSVLVIEVSPLPAGFKRLPPLKGDEEDTSTPRLFRQLNVRFSVPVDVAVVLEASKGNIRVDTRQAPTDVRVAEGNLMILNVAAPLTVRNGEGDTIIADQRGALDVDVNGRTRVTFSEVVGPVRVENATGEVGVYIPAHSSIDLQARSDTGHVRNAFGFPPETYGDRGSEVKGKLGDGEFQVRLVAKKGTMTVAMQRGTE